VALTLEILTPSRKVMNVACESVYLPGNQGEIGILPGHAAFAGTLGTGKVRVKEKDKTTLLAVRDGFIRVISDKVTLLADEAVFPQDVQAAKLEQKEKELTSRLTAAKTLAERESVLADRRWLAVQRGLTSS